MSKITQLSRLLSPQACCRLTRKHTVVPDEPRLHLLKMHLGFTPRFEGWKEIRDKKHRAILIINLLPQVDVQVDFDLWEKRYRIQAAFCTDRRPQFTIPRQRRQYPKLMQMLSFPA